MASPSIAFDHWTLILGALRCIEGSTADFIHHLTRPDRSCREEASKMARIRWVEESEATGDIAEAYRAWLTANPGRPQIPGILKCLSVSPALFRGMEDISNAIHFREGHLTRRVKEMIATYVSALNRCPY
jgi:hypothetical protein